MKIDLKECKDARWQAIQAEIFERDDYTCVNCGESNCKIFVHFKTFEPAKKLWEYSKEILVTLCEDCLAEERQFLGNALTCLSEAARKQFLSNQIDNIAFSLLAMKKPVDVDSETVGETISLWLRTPKLVEFMVKIYQRKLRYDLQKSKDKRNDK